jgi:amino acid transporter
MKSPFVVAQFMEKLYGPWAGTTVTLLILWAAFASLFAITLGYSRIPYAAALEGHFFRPFAKLHPSGQFPHVSLVVVGGLSVLASLLPLEAVLKALMTARILIQFVGQILALHYIRYNRPDIRRPFKMWLYPVPSFLALAGWTYVFVSPGWLYMLYGVLTLAAGIAAYFLWTKRTAS